MQGTQGTGKMAKKNPCQGKHSEFGNVVKTQAIQGILSEHRENTGNFVVNVLILKVKDIAIVAAKKSSFFFQKLDRSAKSFLCM